MKIKYDSDIYDKQAIVHAVNDYSEIAKVTIKEVNNRYIECSFSDCSYEEETTVKEFSNYIIDCMNHGDWHDNS